MVEDGLGPVDPGLARDLDAMAGQTLGEL